MQEAYLRRTQLIYEVSQECFASCTCVIVDKYTDFDLVVLSFVAVCIYILEVNCPLSEGLAETHSLPLLPPR